MYFYNHKWTFPECCTECFCEILKRTYKEHSGNVFQIWDLRHHFKTWFSLQFCVIPAKLNTVNGLTSLTWSEHFSKRHEFSVWVLWLSSELFVVVLSEKQLVTGFVWLFVQFWRSPVVVQRFNVHVCDKQGLN